LALERRSGGSGQGAALRYFPPAGAVNWRSSVDPVDLTARLFRQLVQLIGAIVPPAGATHAVNWRSSVDPVDLGRALRSDIFRQTHRIGADRGGSGRIGPD